jgi:thioredoxin reductase (NADPH)
MDYDVIVIGGGAAGLGGALSLARARRRVLVADDGTPRNAPAAGVHNFLTRDGTPPGELLALGRAEVARYGAELAEATVESAERLGDGFRVGLSDGRVATARRLLVTAGLTDELPAVDGLAGRFGRDVLHCPYCHGWEVRDEPVGILASNPLAVHAALLWRQWTPDVVLFTHDQPEPDPEQAARLAARGIEVVTGEVAAVEVGGDAISGVRLRSGRVVPRRVLVTATRMVARAGFLAGLGLAPADREVNGVVVGSAIDAGPMGETAVPGVYVAGNIADPRQQVIGAAANGALVGGAINLNLVDADTELAMAALSPS